MLLKIYVAGKAETLETVAKKYHMSVETLIAFNPHIISPNRDIVGIRVHIPEEDAAEVPSAELPICPPIIPPGFINDWIPLTPLEKMAQTEYDVLIVGSGAGGGAVLWRLCEQWKRNGKRIGVVERGDLLVPTHARNISTLDYERFDQFFYNPKISKRGGYPEFSGVEQVFALGGRTLFWATESPRMASSEIAKWPLTLQEMDLYYGIAEKIMNVTQSYTYKNSITDLMLQRLQANGYPQATVLPIAADRRKSSDGEIHSNVFFSSILLLGKALNQRSFDLSTNARVVRVLTEREKTVGVEVMSPDKKSHFLKAKTVILATSTLETPRILLNSGIQGEAIGHYLMDHSFVSAKGIMNGRNIPDVLGTFSIFLPQIKGHPYQIEVHGPNDLVGNNYKHTLKNGDWEIAFLCLGQVEPRFENSVTLDWDRRDDYGVPEMDIHFARSSDDKAVIRQMSATMKQMASVMGVRLAALDGQPAVCLRHPGTAHDAGTCRMGDDPSTSATNRFCQIHGVPNLYIADNSVFPNMGAANPTLSTIALAIRTADHIIAQLR
jgi:choline dehydrogenase-like flavoprotein